MALNQTIYKGFYDVSEGILATEDTKVIEKLAKYSGFETQVEALKFSADDQVSITGNIIHRGFSIFDVQLFASRSTGTLCCVAIPNFILQKTDISKMKAGFPFLQETEEYYKLVEHLAGMILVSLREKSDTGHQYGMWIKGERWGFEIQGPYEASGFSVN
jgi:hypothetical protein